MKKNKVAFAFSSAVLVFSCLGLFACQPSANSSSPAGTSGAVTSEESTALTVTFDYNYSGSTANTVKVASGSKVAKPTDPTRSGFTFEAWYTESACTNLYNFDTPVTANLTLYANWLEAGVTYFTVTFHYNDGATANSSVKVKGDSRIAQPSDPIRAKYAFYNWCSDEALTTKFIFSTKITANLDLYAKWGALTSFEAEDLVFTTLSGPGYSGASYGKSMIIKDTMNAQASNGYFVSYLYAKYDSTQYNTTLEFHVTSDAAVSDAKLYLRLSAEYADITINGDIYQVLINGSSQGYSDITFTGASAATDTKSLLAFKDYLIASVMSLKAGDNVITLRTNNTTKQGTGGTMNSTAPVVDCIKVAAPTGNLSWTSGYKGTNNYGDEE